MGCWNATCNVTNLPIHAGEKVVVIPLVKVKEECEFNTCYPTDVFVPFAMPLIGEYDEYGSIENITTFESNKTHLLKNFNYFYGKSDGVNRTYEPVEKTDDFELFVKSAICVHGGCYIKTNSMLHKNGMVETNFMMIHYEAYKIMVEEIAKRKPYDSKLNMREAITDYMVKKIAKSRENVLLHKKAMGEVKNTSNEEKVNALMEAMTFDIYRDLAKETFALGMLNPCSIAWIGFAKELIENENTNELLKQAVDMRLFTKALSCLRKGYLCDSGAGSQSEETRMHYLIAKFVMKHLRDYANEWNAENTDEYKISSHGERETFFM